MHVYLYIQCIYVYNLHIHAYNIQAISQIAYAVTHVSRLKVTCKTNVFIQFMIVPVRIYVTTNLQNSIFPRNPQGISLDIP